jgi:hypothetical protein
MIAKSGGDMKACFPKSLKETLPWVWVCVDACVCVCMCVCVCVVYVCEL